MEPTPDGLVSTRIWPSRGTSFAFAEQQPGVLPPTPNTGVCFSGGGARSHAATVGQLRGLTHLGLVGNIRYISCVSGSSWPCVPYTYYAGPADDSVLLGAVVQPEQLTIDALRRIDDLCLLRPATQDFQATLIRIAERLASPPDRLWIETVGETFLAPYGLFDPARPSSFSLSEATAEAIRRNNPSLAALTFHTVRSDVARPFLVMTSCIVWPDNLLEPEHLVSCEYTPLYVGSPLLQTLTSSVLDVTRTRVVGGGFIEPFAVGSAPPDAAPDAYGRVPVALPKRLFTLADASGTSSSAYSALLDHLDCTLLSPHVSCWPIGGTGRPTAEDFVFADGGSLENTAILALLRRKVERLVVFVNTCVALSVDYDPGCPPGPTDLDASFAQLFGQPGATRSPNQVFSQEDFAAVVRVLQDAKRTGNAAMATTELDVQANAWWGIDGGWRVQVSWVYNDRVASWESRLPADLRALIDAGQPPTPTGPLLDFPHYKTDFENRHALVQLTAEQASLLSHLSCATVIDNAAVFARTLSNQ
jgi:hypothetical protein